MLNFYLGQLVLFKVGSDENGLEVASFCSGVFRFLPSFGDSSESLSLSFSIASPKLHHQKKSFSG